MVYIKGSQCITDHDIVVHVNGLDKIISLFTSRTMESVYYGQVQSGIR